MVVCIEVGSGWAYIAVSVGKAFGRRGRMDGSLSTLFPFEYC